MTTIDDLAALPLTYLASPYTKYRAGPERAYRDACGLAARLLVRGVKLYSPIAHTHGIAIHGGLDPLDHSIWLPFDQAIMNVCDACIVAMMDGWHESRGVAHEIGFFSGSGRPVFYLDPGSLAISDNSQT